MTEIREDMLKVKRMIADVEIILGKRQGETELVNQLIDAQNLLTYCMSRLENAIVPPCNVGDTVYAIGDKDGYQIKECKAEDFSFESAEHFQVGVYFECDSDCDGCYFYSCSQSYCGEWSCDGEYGNGCISVDDFGKNVFLTREEAEKALAERSGK